MKSLLAILIIITIVFVIPYKGYTKNFKVFKFFVVLLLLSGVSFGQQSNSFGISLIDSKTIYKNKKDKFMVVPSLNYTYEKFYVKGIFLGYKLGKMSIL
jgi:outer membrane scaffolding protein for murein synthesis (MipA/OmpV family)